MGDQNEEENENDFEQYPRKEVEFDDKMNIDVSDGDADDENDQNENEQNMESKENESEFDPKSLDEELADKDEQREQEKMEDLERGSSEIMPPNEAKDEALDFIND